MPLIRTVLIVALVLSAFAMFAPPAVQAQDEDPQEKSPGCEMLDGQTVNVDPSPYEFDAAEFYAGEVIILKAEGSGEEYTLTESGAAAESPVLMGETQIFELPADDTYQFGVAVEGTTDDTTLVTLTCATPLEYIIIIDPDIDPDENGNVTLCHYPPGNPGAAHTITVGLPAVYAHLGHGDELGECPDDVESRYDNYEDEFATFVNELEGLIEIWGACVEDQCFLVLVIDLNNLVAEEDWSIEFDSEYEHAPYAVVYFLEPSHLNPNIYVFQVNIYSEWNELLDDTLLIFTDADGNVLGWDSRGRYVQQTELRLNPQVTGN